MFSELFFIGNCLLLEISGHSVCIYVYYVNYVNVWLIEPHGFDAFCNGRSTIV